MKDIKDKYRLAMKDTKTEDEGKKNQFLLPRENNFQVQPTKR